MQTRQEGSVIAGHHPFFTLLELCVISLAEKISLSDVHLIENISEAVKFFAVTLKQMVLSWWSNSIGEIVILGLNGWLTPSPQ